MISSLSETAADVRCKWLRLMIAAVIAMFVLEMMMRVGAPNMLGIPPMNPADLVTSVVALPQGHPLGAMAHLALGLIGFPLGYMIFAYRDFPGPYLSRGALWGVVLWLVAMVLILPLAGQPIFFGFGKPMFAALIAHVVYGVILAVIIGKPAEAE